MREDGGSTLGVIETERKVYSVSDLTRHVRFLLEQNFSEVWVEGQLSGFKRHSSGHMYFALKDEESQLQCVMFRRENQSLPFEPGEGLAVVAFGRISVYAPRGQYQLVVERMEPKGIGALQLRFEQLKEKLRREGLYESERKKAIPYLPGVIGIVTSLDGAVLHDILHVIDRRFSNVRILIYPVPVQGTEAAPRIAEAIDDLNRLGGVDVLIVGRGGGSLEDLWAFNEEAVARAIFRSSIPVVSAVGHEVDFTIADFVADLRAATPSAAAEVLLPLKEEVASRVESLKTRASQAAASSLRFLKLELENLLSSHGFKDPLSFFENQRQRLDELARNLEARARDRFRALGDALGALLGKLEALGPLAVLRRGFSVSMKWPEGSLVTRSRDVGVGELLKTRLSEGFVIGRVTEKGDA